MKTGLVLGMAALVACGIMLPAFGEPEERRSDHPAWWESQEGISDEVLPPYTPVEAVEKETGVEVSIWGRRYRFGAAPFMAQVGTKDAEVLAGPM